MTSSEQPYERREASPRQLRLAIDALLEWPIKYVRTEGLANLAELPVNQPVIVAASHQTGLDMPLAIKALGGTLDLAVTDQSTHHSKDREPAGWIGNLVAGKENFIPISYEWDGDRKVPSMFNPDDVLPMLDAMERGKSILVAAYNPVEPDKDGTSEVPQPGHSAAYLSMMSGAPILPVAIRVGKKDGVGRAEADVVVGKPLLLPVDSRMEAMRVIRAKRASGEKIDREAIAELSAATKELRTRAKEVFRSVRHLEAAQLDVGSEFLLSKLGTEAARHLISSAELTREGRTDMNSSSAGHLTRR